MHRLLARPAHHARRHWVTTVSVFLALALAAVYWFLWWYPRHEVRALLEPYTLTADTLSGRELAELVKESRSTWAQIVAGSALLIGLVFAARQASIAARNAFTAQQGQITDRFAKATEQLGSDRLEMRLGGIYALERIAQDSFRDHWTVIEVLSAFIRERAPWPRRPGPAQRQLDLFGNAAATRRPGGADQPTRGRPDTDVQAALTVIGRRAWIDEEFRVHRSVDLSRTDLRGAFFGVGSFARANFFQSALSGAEIYSADLRDAAMIGVDFSPMQDESGAYAAADLHNVDLRGADLFNANLTGARFREVKLQGARLQRAIGWSADQEAGAEIDPSTLLPNAPDGSEWSSRRYT